MIKIYKNYTLPFNFTVISKVRNKTKLIMKKVFLMLALVLTSAISLVSCRETNEKETVIREVEVERVEKTEPVEENKGILERTAEKVDTEVNKEIDEEIDKIGDDN